MSRCTSKDKIINECIQQKFGVAPIEEKMTEIHLRWFGHVRRRTKKAPLRKVDRMEDSLIIGGK